MVKRNYQVFLYIYNFNGEVDYIAKLKVIGYSLDRSRAPG
jgi:hypothetical protein